MKHLLIGMVQGYRRWISPALPPRCKFYPSCSSYAITALSRYGALRGSALALYRLVRCHPWSLGGVDHVPTRGAHERKALQWTV